MTGGRFARRAPVLFGSASMSPSFAARLAAAAALSGLLAGCMATDRDVTGSIARTGATAELTPEQRDARWRALSDRYAVSYQQNPNDAATAYGYGLALRALGNRAQALAVLESASLRHPEQKQIVGAYGRALAEAGRYEDALGTLEKAHNPEQPDWRILNAQGAILDQLGRSDEARGYYVSALKIAPGEPSVLSNLGLSYALSKDLPKAEATLAQAAANPKADAKVRANLAMVQRLRVTGGAKAAAAEKPARSRPAG